MFALLASAAGCSVELSVPKAGAYRSPGAGQQDDDNGSALDAGTRVDAAPRDAGAAIAPDAGRDAEISAALDAAMSPEDDDPCARGRSRCSALVRCTVVAGEAHCGPCPSGLEDLEGDGSHCVDIDECARGLDTCDESPAAFCINKVASYDCVCPAGFVDPRTRGRNCVRADETGSELPNACEQDRDDCDDDPASCMPAADGGFSCVCPPGFSDVHGDGSDCQDVDECAAELDDCDRAAGAACENTRGGFHCRCPANTLDVAGDGTSCLAGGSRVALGRAHTCVVLDGGRVRCWGANESGQLGLGDRFARGDTPGTRAAALTSVVDLGVAARAVSVAAGCDHSCALLDDGGVKCWGGNASGQLGLGDSASRGDEPNELGAQLSPVPLGGRATFVTAGCGFSCALLATGAVKCWGANAFGQLGLGDTLDRGDAPGELNALPAVDLGKVALTVRAGDRSVCALLADGAVKCWGDGSHGRLGNGSTSPVGRTSAVSPSHPAPVALGTDRTAIVLEMGAAHACAELAGGAWKCWGSNAFGELGLGDGVDRGDQLLEMGDALIELALPAGRHVQAMALGSHGCALLDDGALRCWGRNQYGQLGLGDLRNRGAAPAETPDLLSAVDLGAERRALGVFAGEQHTCALLEDGALKCWGANYAGQLGLGDVLTRGGVPGDLIDGASRVLDLW